MDGVGALMDEMREITAEGRSALGSVCEGEVVRAGRGNLSVQVGQFPPLQKEDLLVNPSYNYSWILDEGQAEYLRPGDKVVLLTADGQSFYLVCKVVACT